MRLTYLDFELQIDPGRGNDYPVALLHSPAGEARETMHFPFEEVELSNCLRDLQVTLRGSGGPRRHIGSRVGSQEDRTVQQFGRALFDALFTGEIRSRYDVSKQQGVQQKKGLRLRLRIQPPDLASLPWEFLYDPREAEYLCLSSSTPVVRYLELPRPIESLTVTPPLRILGMIASPGDLPPLKVNRERERVEGAIKDLQEKELVELSWLEGQTWRDLQRAMRDGPWHIFHFIGHGGFDPDMGEGLIALADEAGKTWRLHASQLGRLLGDHRPLRLVLLNACEGAQGSERDLFSSTAAILVRRGIPAVLAMQYEITDQAAIDFARAFYEALADGMPVDTAVAEARTAVSLAAPDTAEWGTPVLYTRAPDGVIWDMRKKQDMLGSEEQAPWWDRLEVAAGQPGKGHTGGDVITATVGAGARNVAVGKNITQTIYEAIGEPAANDKAIIAEQFSRLSAELGRLRTPLDASTAQMVQFQVKLLQGELTKTGESETPSANTITMAGDWLLENVPQIAEVLASLFATPAVGRVLGKAGEIAVQWVKRRFAKR